MEKFKPDSTNEISIKNNNEISLPKIINSEVNLLRSPFFVLARKNKILEIEYREIIKRGDLKKERVWNVSANPKYGYPGPFDREVHKAIEQIISEILREKKEIENPIPFSIYNLCNRMGVSFKDGGNFKRVRSSFEKIRATTIKSERAFYHKGKKKWISKVFGLYDGVIFRGEQLEDGSIAETNLLYLSDIYLESLNSHHIKSIDYTY
ncbi:MAG: replication initiator protein A, partial [Candidatus Atribacteria bacterium]|nr:replication initiator protein A [Candidatus Atribacteria bacterium]